MSKKWTAQDIPALTGKIIVVTGANSGLGFECSKILAKKGATVVMTARNMDKGEKAKAAILNENPQGALDLMKLDVGNLQSVREFAEAFKTKYDRLDILLNNAGLMAIPRQETVDGFEMQLGVNHLGHFALTGLLLDIITQTPNALIHNVTSSANFMGKINFDDLMGEKEYGRWTAYGQSKLANVLFTFELQKRLKAAGYATMANVSHPGLVYGNLQENSMKESDTAGEMWFYRIARPLLARDISRGIEPMLYAMTSSEAKGGALYGPKYMHHYGSPAAVKANKTAYDTDTLQRFWKISEELTGITYNFA